MCARVCMGILSSCLRALFCGVCVCVCACVHLCVCSIILYNTMRYCTVCPSRNPVTGSIVRAQCNWTLCSTAMLTQTDLLSSSPTGKPSLTIILLALSASAMELLMCCVLKKLNMVWMDAGVRRLLCRFIMKNTARNYMQEFFMMFYFDTKAILHKPAPHPKMLRDRRRTEEEKH